MVIEVDGQRKVAAKLMITVTTAATVEGGEDNGREMSSMGTLNDDMFIRLPSPGI